MNTREKLSKVLNRHLDEYDWHPDKLYPAKGAWRTNKALDVWCWEGSAKCKLTGISKPVGSYQTMTELCGCDQFRMDWTGEIFGWISRKKNETRL